MSANLIPVSTYRYDTDFVVTALSGTMLSDVLPPSATISWHPIIIQSGNVVIIDPHHTRWGSVSSAFIADTTTPYSYGTCGFVSEISSISGSFLVEAGRFGLLLSACSSFSATANYIELDTEYTDIVSGKYTGNNEMLLSAVRVTSTGPDLIAPTVSGYWSTAPTGGVSAIVQSTSAAIVFDQIYKATDVDAIAVFSDAVNSSYGIQFTTVDSWRRNPSTLYETTPVLSFELNEDVTLPTQASLNAYINRIGDTLRPQARLVWSVEPTTGSVFTTGANVQLNTISGATASTSAAYISSVGVSGVDLRQTYTITLSSNIYSNTASETFRPYLSLTSTSLLSASAQTGSASGVTQEFTTNVKGVTNGRVHNLDRYQSIGWSISSTNQAAINRVTATDRYRTLYDFFPSTQYTNADSLDTLYITITPLEWNGIGAPTITPYTLTVSAVSSVFNVVAEQDDTILIDSDTITIHSSDIIPDSIYLPQLRVNYEPLSSVDIYREWTSSYSLSVFNESIFPGSATSGTALLNIGTSSIMLPYDFSATSLSFESSSPGVYPVSMTTSIGGSGWVFNVDRTSEEIRLHLVSEIPTADFVLFPSLKWDEGTQLFASVSGISDSPGPSAYDFCHTEVFNLSGSPVSGAQFNWFVANTTPSPLSSTLDEVTVSMQSPTPSVHNVTLRLSNNELPVDMPSFFYDDTTGLLTRYANNTVSVSGGDPLWTVRGDITLVQPPTGSVASINTSGEDIEGGSQLTLVSTFNSSSSGPLDIDTATTTYAWTICAATLSQVIDSSSSTTVVAFDNISTITPVPVTAFLEQETFFKSKDSTVNDFCKIGNTTTDNQVIIITPIYPAVYTANYYVIAGEPVRYQPLGVSSPQVIDATWDSATTSLPSDTYVSTYSNAGLKSVQLDASYSLASGIEAAPFVSNDIISVRDSFQAYDIQFTRVPGVDSINLPNDRLSCRAPFNEWLTADNIRNVMNKLWGNLEFIQRASQIYAPPPSKYFGWLGNIPGNYGNEDRWHTFHDRLDQYSDQYNQSVSGRFSDLQDIAVVDAPGVTNGTHFVSNSTIVRALSSDAFATQINSIDRRSLDDTFANIVAITTDSDFATNRRVYMLDKAKNRVMVFQYNTLLNTYTLLYFWGGLGGPAASARFNQPQDMIIDPDNVIWVVDSGNRCIKRFSRTGSWISTESIGSDVPISVAQHGDTVVIACRRSLILRQGGIESIIPLSTTPVRVRPCMDGDHFYVVYKTEIHKIRSNGKNVGTFAQNPLSDYRSVFHDAHRNLFIVDCNKILKYVDALELISLQTPVDHLYWPKSATYVEEQEYVQDWVYTRVFQRMYDNIELLRRSVNGKFDYIDNQPVVRTLRSNEYRLAPHLKRDIIFGVNEFVTADVFNRNIDKLFDCLDSIVDMIQE